MMLMGPAGPGQWRTSTLSTKWPRAGLSHVSEVTWDTLGDDENGPNHWITHYVCFSFKAVFCFFISSVSMLINPSGSAASS